MIKGPVKIAYIIKQCFAQIVLNVILSVVFSSYFNTHYTIITIHYYFHKYLPNKLLFHYRVCFLCNKGQNMTQKH